MNETPSMKALSRVLGALGSFAVALVGIFGALAILLTNSLTLLIATLGILINSCLAVFMAQSLFMRVIKVVLMLFLLQWMMSGMYIPSGITH